MFKSGQINIAAVKMRNMATSLTQERLGIRHHLRELMRTIGERIEMEAKTTTAFQDDTGTLRESIQYKVWTGRGFGNSMSASVTIGPRGTFVRPGGTATVQGKTLMGRALSVLDYAPIIEKGRGSIQLSGTRLFTVWMSRERGKVAPGKEIAAASPRPFMAQAWRSQEKFVDERLDDFGNDIVNRIIHRGIM